MVAAADIAGVLTRALAGRAEILEAYLFGSQARGTAAAHSDVDVAVYLDEARVPAAPYGYPAALATDLMAALGRSDVDVVVLNRAPPLLYHRVLRDGVRLLSRSLRATTVREGRALSRWCDWAPQQRKFDEAFAARARAGKVGR
ncbi:MAG: type VII toxin-antitoxin system MntA family adenylyltransferase antitoxin [Deltaproteobacteria bacterium]